MQYLPITGELKRGEKYILIGIILAFLLGGFGDMPLLGLLIMVAGGLMLFIGIGPVRLLNTPLTRPLLLMILIAVVSLLKIGNLISAASMMGTLLEILFSFFASYYIFKNKSADFHRKMLIVLFTGGVIAGLFGVYEHFFLPSRRLALINNSNLLGVYMMFLFLLALSTIYQQGYKYKLVGIILSFLFGFNLIYSLSRSAFLGAVSGLIIFFSVKYKKFLIVFLIIILIAPLVLPNPFMARFKNLYQSFISGNYDQRIYIWKSAYEMFKDNPILGVGIGQFYENYPKYLSPEAPLQTRLFSHAHNIVIQIMSELGLLGLAIFIYLLFIIIKISYKSLPFPSDYQGNLSLGLSSAFVGFFIQEMFEFSLSGSGITILVSILLSWYLVLIKKDNI